jgi:hypothetical protein
MKPLRGREVHRRLHRYPRVTLLQKRATAAPLALSRTERAKNLEKGVKQGRPLSFQALYFPARIRCVSPLVVQDDTRSFRMNDNLHNRGTVNM